MTSGLGRWILVLGTAMTVSCSSTPTLQDHPEYDRLQGEIERVCDYVRNTSGAELYSHLKRLVAYDVFAVDQVMEMADDPNARLRCNAIWVLAQVRDPKFPDVERRIYRTLRNGLDDGDRLVRFEAASGLVGRNSWDVIPVLFEGMEDADPSVRFNCHETLKLATSKDFGYLVDAPANERSEALRRWERWFDDWDLSEG